MNELLSEVVKIIPAIVFPGAALIQLAMLIKNRSASGVSATAWWLFALANICLYIYTGKSQEFTAIITFLGTATLNIAVALTTHCLNRRTAS